MVLVPHSVVDIITVVQVLWQEETKAATGGVLWKKVFLTILQNNFIKKETMTQVFPCQFCEIFTSFLQNTCAELLLKKSVLYFGTFMTPITVILICRIYYQSIIISIKFDQGSTLLFAKKAELIPLLFLC